MEGHPLQCERGFTLVEILAVFLVIAVVAASVLFRQSTGSADLISSADRLKTHLRYAQSRSMNSDVIWGIVFSGGTYSLTRDITGTLATEPLPGEGTDTVSLPVSVTGTVSFDSWGRPAGLSTIDIGGVNVIITPETGFIP